MNPASRLLTVLGLALAVLIGSSLPASAGFSDRAQVATSSVTTATVAAPATVTGKLTCSSSTSTMGVTWTPSGSRGVSGYRVTVTYSDGFEQSEVVDGASTSSWTKSTTTYNVTAYSIRYSVTALTTYGWSTQSALTGSFRC